MVESNRTAGRCDVHQGPRPPRGSAGSFLASVYFCCLCQVYFLLTSDRVAHWFVIPVVICGVLIGTDGIDWLRGRRDIFDPVGIVGLLGIHVFFLAPAHSTQPGVWYAGSSPIGLFKTVDDGMTWSAVAGFNDNPRLAQWCYNFAPGTPDGQKCHSVQVDPLNPNRILVGLSGGGLFLSDDQGES